MTAEISSIGVLQYCSGRGSDEFDVASFVSGGASNTGLGEGDIDELFFTGWNFDDILVSVTGSARAGSEVVDGVLEGVKFDFVSVGTIEFPNLGELAF